MVRSPLGRQRVAGHLGAKTNVGVAHPLEQEVLQRRAEHRGDFEVVGIELDQANQLTVRAAEKLARELANPKESKPQQTTSREADAVIEQIQSTLRERFATEVKLSHTPKKGKIELAYYGNDDLQRLLDLLGIQL